MLGPSFLIIKYLSEKAKENMKVIKSRLKM
jgi:hypothetical protein